MNTLMPFCTDKWSQCEQMKLHSFINWCYYFKIHLFCTHTQL